MNSSDKKLIEKLFLTSCIPSLKKITDELSVTSCIGCKDSEPNQLGHTCVNNDDFPGFEFTMAIRKLELVKKAGPFLSGKFSEIMETMRNLILTEEEYASVTLLGFLGFFADSIDTSPLNRITWDQDWRQKLFRLLSGYLYEDEDTETSENDKMSDSDESVLFIDD